MLHYKFNTISAGQHINLIVWILENVLHDEFVKVTMLSGNDLSVTKFK